MSWDKAVTIWGLIATKNEMISGILPRCSYEKVYTGSVAISTQPYKQPWVSTPADNVEILDVSFQHPFYIKEVSLICSASASASYWGGDGLSTISAGRVFLDNNKELPFPEKPVVFAANGGGTSTRTLSTNLDATSVQNVESLEGIDMTGRVLNFLIPTQTIKAYVDGQVIDNTLTSVSNGNGYTHTVTVGFKISGYLVDELLLNLIKP